MKILNKNICIHNIRVFIFFISFVSLMQKFRIWVVFSLYSYTTITFIYQAVLSFNTKSEPEGHQWESISLIIFC